MKILYIAAVDSENPTGYGVIKKIYGQVKAFNELGHKCDLISIKNNYISVNNKATEYKLSKPYYMSFHKRLINKFDDFIKEYDLIYIRYYSNDYFLYKLTKILKKYSKKVVLEIPTYPLDVVQSNVIKKYVYELINKIVRSNLKEYIDYIAVTNDYEKIYGVETIKINNGIDLNMLPCVMNKDKNVNEIHLGAVANLAKWHGYDRVINGIYEYKKHKENNYEVYFHIIGEGSEKKNLIKLTNTLGIEKNIIFEGAKNGQELDKLFDKIDIGVSSLALFRAGGGHDPIKSKEYIGRGLPVLLGYEDRVIDMSLPYVIKVDENDSAIDIIEVIKKFNNIFSTSKDIRQYAESNLTWNSQMAKVINKFE